MSLTLAGAVLVVALQATTASAGSPAVQRVAAPSQSVGTTTQSADDHFNQGAALRRAGKLDDAIAEYRKAIELDPRNANYRNLLGAALRAAGKFDEAEAELRRALALEPENATAHSNLGNLLCDQARFADAITEYQAALKINPESGYLVLRLHLARFMAGQDDRAELLENANQLDMKRWPAPIVDLYLGKTTADAVMGLAASGSAETQREQTCEARYYIGSLALREGRPSEAKPLLRAAAEGCPPHFVEAVGAKNDLKGLPPD